MAKIKEVNLNGVTSGNYGDYQYGALSTYTPKYDTQINNTLGKIENYGNYTSKYQPQLDEALTKVTDRTPYTSRYQAQIDDYVNKIQADYDPNSDASYLAYKNQYLRGGQKAMQDTMAKAVALSGGYDNSYANSVAQQTYNDYAAALADKIPELAKAAQDMYSNRLSMFQNLDATDYGRWADDRANNYNILSALQGMDNTEYGRWQDNRANLYDLLNAYQNQEDTNYGRFKDEYSMWNTAYGQAADLAGLGSGGSGGGGGRGRKGRGGSGEDIYTTVNRMVNNGSGMSAISNVIGNSYLSGTAAAALGKAAQQAVIDRDGTRSQINADLASRKKSGKNLM